MRLSNLYELHEGKFQLPTVAAYLAHQDALTNNPAILNAEVGLDLKIASLAADDRLVRNLAAMVFNVEEDLAFQILLDNEIAKAVTAETTDTLVKLSYAPGFDLRVDDVVQANMDEWRSTGEFGNAIKNFFTLFETYKGDAREHVAKALLSGFERVERLSIKGEGYLPFLRLLEIASDQQRPTIVAHLVHVVFEDINQQETNSFTDGKNLASFIKSTNVVLEGLHAASELSTELGQQTPPNSPEFMFGLGASIADAGFTLSDFENVKVDIPEESEYFTEKFVQYPILAIPALVQFQACQLLPDDEWLSIANACLTDMKDEDVNSDNVGHLLEIVSLIWHNIDRKRTSEIELENALTNGEFFKNVGEGQTEPSLLAQANLLFLVQDKLGGSLGNPTKVDANNVLAPDTSDAFEAFKLILEGEAELEKGQVKMVARKTIDAKCARHWINFGNQNREHKSVRQIVLNMFVGNTPPYLNLSDLLSHFPYISELLNSDSLTETLRIYAERIKDTEVEKLKISDLPLGILRATHALGNGNWETLHSHVDQLLKSISSDAWPEHIENMDHTVAILIEKLGSSRCALDSGEFRKPFVKVIKDVLAGQSEIEAAEGSLDTLMAAIDSSYYENVWRTLREEMSGVTSSSLQVAMNLFPELIASIAQRGDRILKAEKDNVIRNLLIPALEGRNEQALRIFVDMGFTKLKDFQNAAATSSTNMLEGAWKSFSEVETDRDLIRAVSEAIHGKRKTKSIFDPGFWLGARD